MRGLYSSTNQTRMNGDVGDARRTRDERIKRKKLLQDELRTVQEQRAAIEQQLAAFRAGAAAGHGGLNGNMAQPAAPAAAPTHQAATPTTSRGVKRPAPGPAAPVRGTAPSLVVVEESREAKRARIEAERAKRVQNLFTQCANIVKTIKKAKDAGPFILPVDPGKLGIPDYFNIVKKPMDFTTVLKKLEHKPEKNTRRQYDDVYQFRDDVRQIWLNCQLYNAPGQVVREMGDRVMETWEKRWEQSQLESKWEEELRRQKAEDMELDGKAELAAEQVPVKVAELDANLRELQAKVESQPDLSRPAWPTPPNRIMTFEEKRKLSQHLGMLPGERLDEVVQIVSQAVQLPAGEDEDEFELDIDSLDNVTLWRLDALAREVLGLAKKEGTGGPPRTRDGAAVDQPETSSKPAGVSGTGASNGTAAARPGGASEGAAAAAAAANNAGSSGARQPEEGDGDSSSSSSSGESSSDDGSDEEVGSRENVGSTFGDGRDAKNKRATVPDGGDGTTFVSATRPSGQAQILKSSTQRKEPMVTNAAAWKDLAAGAAAVEGDGDDGERANNDDELWKEFKTRAEEEEKRKQEKEEQEERIKKARAEEARKAREMAEQKKKQREEEEERLKKEEEAKIEAAKAEERAALERQMNRVDLTSQQAMMKDFDKQGTGDGDGSGFAELGLVKESESDDSGSDEDI